MQKILRICNFPTNLFSGAGLHGYHLQNMTGYKTIFVSPKLLGVPLELHQKDSLVLYKNFLFAKEENENYLVHKVKRYIGALRFNLFCIKELLKEKPDIVHIHSPYFLILVLFSRIMKKRCFITYHGSDYKAVHKLRWYRMVGFLFEKAFHLGSHMKEGLEKIHKKGNAIEVFNGVDNKLFTNPGQPRDRTIIAVGSLKKEKGFKFLIKAFKQLISDQKYSDYKLKIIGSGTLEKTLEGQIKTLNLVENVSLLGHLDRDAVISVYQRSEMFVLSSISEGFPKVLLEAAACGCKIVTTDVGSVRFVLGKNFKSIVPVADPERLQETMKEVLRCEPDQILSSLSERFTWKDVSSRYIEAYEK